MARIFSGAMKANLIQVNAHDIALSLIEINHPSLGSPIRIVNDNKDIISNGNTFIACPFVLSLPNDTENEVARAKLELDNVGRAIVMWIEQTNGAEAATVTLFIVQDNDPDTIEFEITMNFNQISINTKKVSGSVGYDNLLNARSMNRIYDPDSFKGLY